MHADALLLEMLTDADLRFALRAAGIGSEARQEAVARSLAQDPGLVEALLDDGRLYPAVAADPNILLKVTPYFYFSVLLRRARRELHGRSFTAEWLAPRRRVPVFDASRVAAVLEDRERVHYLTELLASFVAVRRVRGADGPPAAPEAPGPRGARRRLRRTQELDLNALRRLRDRAPAADQFALGRRLGDVALFLAGVFPDSASGVVELEAWETESAHAYRRASRDPLARTCGLDDTLAALAADLHPTRKALNFVADRFLNPLRYNWFVTGA
jgi:hypothetical protein